MEFVATVGYTQGGENSVPTFHEHILQSTRDERRRLEWEKAAMARPIKLHAPKVPEVELQAHRSALILSVMDFLLWGWNWASEAIVQEWDNNGLPKPLGYRGNP